MRIKLKAEKQKDKLEKSILKQFILYKLEKF